MGERARSLALTPSPPSGERAGVRGHRCTRSSFKVKTHRPPGPLKSLAWLLVALAVAGNARATELGIDKTAFTLDGRPTFLLGASYYGALGAPENFIRRDLDDLQHHGFNWIRVWATWTAFTNDVSAVDSEGRAREPFLGKLAWLVGECDRRGLVVDVTLTRGDGPAGLSHLATFPAHQRAVETLVTALKSRRNWYLDLANERNIRDARFVSVDELRRLRDTVKRLDPARLVTASHAGGDLAEQDVRRYLIEARLDFLAPHRPRERGSAAQTEAKTKEALAWMQSAGRTVPILYQEPFRRGYGAWQPGAAEFATDLAGARQGGAAGWCWHNGDTRGAPGNEPRRSFDLRQRRLFDQLDDEERRFLASLPSPTSAALRDPDHGPWPTATPAEVGLDAAALRDYSDYVGGRGCVVRHGKLVYSWGDITRAEDVASAVKPFFSFFLFKALEDGRIPSLDEKVVRWEPRLADLNPTLANKDIAITWRHMANQISCYGLAERPGTAFCYNDWQMALFADLLFNRVYGVAWASVDAKVLHPMLTDLLGFEDHPSLIAFGTGDRPGRLAISPRDFARFGQLFLQRGRWGERQILRADLAVMAVTSPLPASLPRAGKVAAEMIPGQRTLGSREIPDNQTEHFGSYSWLWWVNGVERSGQRHWPDAPADLFAALGHGGIRGLAVMPGLDLIVSWNDGQTDNPAKENEAYRRLMRAVQRGTQSNATSTASPALPANLRAAFSPPREFAGDLGKYGAVLRFADGRPVKTAADWTERRAEIRKYWEKTLGPWPPLIAEPGWEILRSERRENFTQQRVRVEIAPAQSAEGWLLTPDGSGPFPAVLVPFYEPETSIGLGKPGRDFAYRLAKLGFVSLAIGSPGGDAWKPVTGGATCQPLSFLAYVAANCANAFANLPSVDPARLGVVGHSYGGKWALFAGALCDRFAAVVVSDPGIVWDETRPNVNYWEPWYLGRDPAVQRKPGVPTADNPRTGAYRELFEAGHDLPELLALIAPRPLLVSGGSEDPPARWRALNAVVAVNALLGQTNRVAFTSRATHDPTTESSAQVDAFFTHFLGGARTRVAIADGRWQLNGEVTYRGAPAEGLLLNVRMVNAVFEDRRRRDFDPDANTAAFVARIPDYVAHGVRAFTLNLQGGMPGYEGAENSAFVADGSLRESYLRRVRRVIEASDRQGAVVILGCFYQRQDQVLADANAVRTGVVNVARWIRDSGFRNVVLEIANEFPHGGFDRAIIKTPAGEAELIRLAKQTAPGLLVSSSGVGNGRLDDPAAEAADFILVHFNDTKVADIPARIAALRRFGKPIVCNEDDKTGEAGAQALEACVASGASWGFMAEKVNQAFPFRFGGAADDPPVYAAFARCAGK